MDILFIAIIIVLCCTVIWLVFFLKKKHKDYDAMIEEYQMEAAVSIGKVENNLKQEKEEVVEKVKVDYETKMNDYKEYVDSVEKISRNADEINTHTILTEIKKELVLQGKVQPLQMIIFANIFLPYRTVDSEQHSIKIDHLVLMNSGIYLIDTKNLHGKILYGMTKEQAKEFSLIFEQLYPFDDADSEKTIVITNNKNLSNELRIMSSEDPAEQVMTGVDKLHRLLKERVDNIKITPILYFDQHDNHFVNYSQNASPCIIENRETLYEFFLEQLEESETKYSVAELEKFAKIIEDVNIDTCSFNTTDTTEDTKVYINNR